MIGIFDSGIGGVTVFREILKKLPNYSYIYYSDSKNNPYGDKTHEELIEITEEIVDYLVSHGCKIIVIACNTASAICKDYLRDKFDVPIIAIEPAYKMVNDTNPQGKTLILATKGTLESEKFKELYQKYDNHHTSIYECVGLADLIEQNKTKEIDEYLIKHLTKFKGVENVVLGCTHYPLITDKIKKVLGDVRFYDGSLGVVHRLEQIITSISLKPSGANVSFIDSSYNPIKKERFEEILGQRVN